MRSPAAIFDVEILHIKEIRLSIISINHLGRKDFAWIEKIERGNERENENEKEEKW